MDSTVTPFSATSEVASRHSSIARQTPIQTIMDTDQSDPISGNQFHAGPRRPSGTRGFTLAEIMVATVIFTITSLALAASLIQNTRFTTALSYRTQALNISMGIVEQIRQMAYLDILGYCNKAYGLPSTALFSTVNVVIMDPLNTNTTYANAPANYQQIQLPINQFTEVNGTVHTGPTWLQTNVPMDLTPAAAKMPIRWWLTINNNQQPNSTTGVATCDVLEIVLTYQWQIPGTTTPTWQSGTIRLIIPNDAAA
jgi:prepilin-type N-terminal cleavage/methylation domain-containing protein